MYWLQGVGLMVEVHFAFPKTQYQQHILHAIARSHASNVRHDATTPQKSRTFVKVWSLRLGQQLRIEHRLRFWRTVWVGF